jgi:hypothetical protein
MLKTVGTANRVDANNVKKKNRTPPTEWMSTIGSQYRRTQTTALVLKREVTPDTAGMSTIEETTTTVETPGTEGKSTTAGSDKTQHNSMNAKNRLGVSHSRDANNRRDTNNSGKTLEQNSNRNSRMPEMQTMVETQKGCQQ